MHIPGADLHLKGNTLRADDGGVQALVHIGLGGGDIVLKPTGNQIKQIVDMPQNIVAVGNGVHDDPESVNIVKLFQGLILLVHFPVDGINVLDTAVGFVVDTHTGKTLSDPLLNGTHKGFILLLVGIQVADNICVGGRIQIPQGDIFQLPLDLLHTKTVGKGGIDIHGFPALFDLLFRGLVLHGTHIVEPVSDLDQHHPDVLGHSHKHLPQVFHLGLLGAGEIGAGQLGNTLYQFGNGRAEQTGNFIVGSVGVFNAVVEQGA